MLSAEVGGEEAVGSGAGEEGACVALFAGAVGWVGGLWGGDGGAGRGDVAEGDGFDVGYGWVSAGG